MMSQRFDSIAQSYDRWYDTPLGSALFNEEVECLRRLWDDFSGRWLEVGVGTGRFAAVLGISCGIDLSAPMAVKAARRGVRVCIGRAEQPPFQAHAFDGVLMVLTLCFLESPETGLRACTRLLRENGRLVLGIVPADSPWGKAYIRKGDEGHPVYAHARFHTIREAVRIVEQVGFTFRRGCSALFWKPENSKAGCVRVETGIVAEAGFVGLLFEAHSAGV